MTWTLIACLSLIIAACGGGGGGGGGEQTTSVSGVAMKGPIKGAWVGVYQLKSDGTTGDLLGSGTSDNVGDYDIKIPTSKATGQFLIVVKGQSGAKYFSESLKRDVEFTNANESFSAVVNAADASQGVTVGPLTEAAYQKLQQNLTDNPGLVVDARIINAVNAQIATLFNVDNILADPAGDPAYLAALTVIDQMVVDTGSLSTLETMNVINQGLINPVLTAPSYQIFQQALNEAATTVIADAVIAGNTVLLSTVQDLQAQIDSPPVPPVLTDTTPPTAPANLTATASALTATTSSVALAWTASVPGGQNAVSGYDVYRDEIKIATVTTPGYTDSSVAPNVTYIYHVIAFDAAGNRSAASSKVSVKPLPANLGITVNGQLSAGILGLPPKDVTAPTAPSNLSASASAISATASSVSLSWAAATDDTAVTAYEIYRDSTLIKTVPVPGYTDPSVTSEITYIYSVKALDAAGNRSTPSNLLSVTPPIAALNVTFNGQLSSAITGL